MLHQSVVNRAINAKVNDTSHNYVIVSHFYNQKNQRNAERNIVTTVYENFIMDHSLLNR